MLDPSCSCDDVEPSYLDAATSGDALRDILLGKTFSLIDRC